MDRRPPVIFEQPFVDMSDKLRSCTSLDDVLSACLEVAMGATNADATSNAVTA